MGNTISIQTNLTDEFLSIGWGKTGKPSNFIKSGSLFQWKLTESKRNKDIDLLFVLGCPTARSPEINSAYSDSDPYGSTVYIESTKSFLANLSPTVLSNTYIRGYPKEKLENCQYWDQAWEFRKYIANARCYDDSTNSGKDLISRARMVVVNYLSTTHLESLISDTPTIIIWNSKSAHFTTEYFDLFDDLLNAGVCHRNPIDAANFVDANIKNPYRWWNSTQVRTAVGKFLTSNIGDQLSLQTHLLSKCK